MALSLPVLLIAPPPLRVIPPPVIVVVADWLEAFVTLTAPVMSRTSPVHLILFAFSFPRENLKVPPTSPINTPIPSSYPVCPTAIVPA